MHLKRLQLVGFKTFAERTTIEFTPGVTAIVGPNGSGKSNIADAILWVLGEQRASAIRGTKLQDVIFSGSALRKATGLAEVSLTIDNSDGSLPLAFDEVTVTRRAYRSGEGEFFINKTPCRLKDIQELFLDTGVGRESYALVNQSEVDAVLAADPQARRPLFEEAAGIHKFRVKKREALRKLEQTENNLIRIRDIVREIERRLGPLEEQAEIAIKFNTAKERLESLERNYLISEVRLADQELEQLTVSRAEFVSTADAKARHAAQAQERADSLAQSLAVLDSQLEDVRRRYQSALSAAERARSAMELSDQRRQAVAAQIEMIRAELTDLDDRIANVKSLMALSNTETSSAHDTSVSSRAQIESLEARRREIQPKIAQIRQAHEAARMHMMQTERARIGLEADVASARARVTQVESVERELADRISSAKSLEAETKRLHAAHTSDHRTASDDFQAAEQAVRDADTAVRESRDAISRDQAQASGLLSQRASANSRLQTLQELEASQEGYYAGVRAVLQAAQRGHLNGDYTVVADAIRAPQGYELAFETALGGAVQDIIVDSEQEAKAGIELLKRSRAGRATFLPLTRIRPYGSAPDVPKGIRGYLGCAADLATCDPKYDNIVIMLLGRVLICETVDDAISVADRSKGWSKIVSLSGEVILPTGAITGGSAPKAGSGQLLHRKSEIAQLTEKAADAEKTLAACDDAIASSQMMLKILINAHDKAISTLSETRQKVNAAERQLDQSARELTRTGSDRDSATSRLANLKADKDQAHAALATKEAAYQAAIQAVASDPGNEFGAGDSAQLQILLETDQQLQDELVGLRVGLASAQEKERMEGQAVRTTTAELERLSLQRARRAECLEALISDLAGLDSTQTEMSHAVTTTASSASTLQSELESKQSERNTLATQVRDAQLLARSLDAQRAEAQMGVQASDIREAKLQMQQSQAAARLLDEYDTTLGDALALEATPHVDPETPREVARLRRELRSYGEVNTHAAAEYMEIKERYDNMTTQQLDAEAAKEKVLVAIREIDDSTRGLFMATFHQVSEAFEQIFKRLMGGGTTELTLTDPDNLLETGVEIAVQAPGKRKQNLLLLSGGERALTAVALLFAFLHVRPAPFCVMDEVDAPLDGVNVERFASLLRDIGQTSQFLVITHNPSTMEAARCWYGITMQEPGVSRVLSMSAPENASTDKALVTTEAMVPDLDPADAELVGV